MNWHMLSFYSWTGEDFIRAHSNDDNKANKYCYFVFSSSTEVNDAWIYILERQFFREDKLVTPFPF